MEYPDGKKIETWVSLPREVYRKVSKMKMDDKTREVLNAVLENTLGYEQGKKGRESVRRTGRSLAPSYIEKQTGISEATVRRAYDQLEKRRVIRRSMRPFPHKDETGTQTIRNTTYVEINTNIDEWVMERIKKGGNQGGGGGDKMSLCLN